MFYYFRLLRKLKLIEKSDAGIEEEAVRSIRAVQRCLGEYREIIREQGLEIKLDKVIFFKMIKPRIVAKLIYFTKMFNWWNDRPRKVGSAEQRRYWKSKSRMIESFFQEHGFCAGTS